MYLVEESEYISGLVNMASSVSKYMGCSFMDATCFKKKDFLNSFSYFYNIDKKDIKIHETSITLEEFIKNYFGDNKELIDGLSFWISLKTGDLIHIYELDDDCKLCDLLSNSGYGKTPFYCVDDVIIIEFKKMTIAFIVGNNE